MVADAGNSADWAQNSAAEFLGFRRPQRIHAAGPHPAAVSHLHSGPAEAYEALSRRPFDILSMSRILEQSIPYPFVMDYWLRIPRKGRHRVMENYHPKDA